MLGVISIHPASSGPVMLFGRIVKSRKLLRIYRELRVSNMNNNRIMALSFDTGGYSSDYVHV